MIKPTSKRSLSQLYRTLMATPSEDIAAHLDAEALLALSEERATAKDQEQIAMLARSAPHAALVRLLRDALPASERLAADVASARTHSSAASYLPQRSHTFISALPNIFRGFLQPKFALAACAAMFVAVISLHSAWDGQRQIIANASHKVPVNDIIFNDSMDSALASQHSRHTQPTSSDIIFRPDFAAEG